MGNSEEKNIDVLINNAGFGLFGEFAETDLEKEITINPEEFLSKGRNTPYANEKVNGIPVLTISNGKIAYIDEEGNASKPFLLPQKDTDYYHRFMKSYNIPEFITGKVSSKIRALSTLAKEDKGIDVTYRK